MEPVSHFFYSDRLKLQLWDYGQDGKPPLILVHGGMDHARSWDRIARAFSADYHVYAYDLRGHGNSEWARGGMYTVPEHVLDLTTLAAIVGKDEPLRLVGLWILQDLAGEGEGTHLPIQFLHPSP